MANPIGCQICGQVSNAEFLVTDLTDGFQILGVPTQGVCVRCFIDKAMELANALQAAMAEIEAAGGEPGVLESIEADEGEVVAADPVPAKPKSKAKAEPAPAAQPEESETPAADVHP